MDWKLQNNHEKRYISRSKSVSWKPRKTSEEHAGRYNLSYKREKKLVTDRQPKYCNPHAHAPSVNYRHNMSNTDTASLAGHTLLGLGVWSRCEAAVVPSTKAETHLILLEGL